MKRQENSNQSKIRSIQVRESIDNQKRDYNSSSQRSSSAQSNYKTEFKKKDDFCKMVTQTMNPSTEKPNCSNSPSRHKLNLAHSVNLKYLLPPKKVDKKTLILDLDETLIHSNFEEFAKGSDIKINVKIDNQSHKIFAMKRPGVEEFLDRMSKIYEIVIYTASLQQVSFIFKPIFSMQIK